MQWSSRASSLAAVAFAFAACTDAPAPTSVVPSDESSALATSNVEAQESDPVPGQYIVVFRDDVRDAPGLARRLAAGQGGSVLFTYTAAIKGFAFNGSAAAAAALSRNPNVAYVEQDQTVHISTTQTNATWGLDRVDQADLPLNREYTYGETAAGVVAYIIDTGIRSDHVEFGGRVSRGFSSVNDRRGTEDCNGHGTHVAGTVGGTTYGVAKQVTLVPVRVLNCRGSGTWSGVIAGMDFVTANAVKPAVANMSLGGGKSQSVNDAAERMVASGVFVAVAAGNSNDDACNYSPASEPTVETVGATTNTDARASYSNFGGCVDIFAPGSSIKSAWHSSKTSTNTISGTSMASPHVAGVAALYLAVNGVTAPDVVATGLHAIATMGRVGNEGTGSPDRLLFTNY